MPGSTCFESGRCQSPHAQRPTVILINGLAEQSETWFRNEAAWRRHFDLHTPEILVYDNEYLHRRLRGGLPIDIEFLARQLQTYVTTHVQQVPFDLVACSMGAKLAVHYGVANPKKVRRIVLLGPAGLGGPADLPVFTGLRSRDARGLVNSVFADPTTADPRLYETIARKLSDRRWRLGFLAAVRGTRQFSVAGLLPVVTQPTLIVAGMDDRIVGVSELAEAAKKFPRSWFRALPNCGHAPHQEFPDLVNRLVMRFLTRRHMVNDFTQQAVRQRIPSSELVFCRR